MTFSDGSLEVKRMVAAFTGVLVTFLTADRNSISSELTGVVSLSFLFFGSSSLSLSEMSSAEMTFALPVGEDLGGETSSERLRQDFHYPYNGRDMDTAWGLSRGRCNTILHRALPTRLL